MKTASKLSASEPVAIRGGRYLDCYTAPEKFRLSVAIGVILLCSVNPLRAGETMTDKDAPVKKSPSFEQADKNADHVVTKEELNGYSFLLEYFDRVDAGKDGKLEQHEYENLIMEKKREGEYE